MFDKEAEEYTHIKHCEKCSTGHCEKECILVKDDYDRVELLENAHTEED